MVYKVKLEKFEGPFEILLNLIEENKLSINEISLANVAEDFLSYIKSAAGLPRKEAASFLLVGTTLMLIKSRTLIPSLEITKEEEESIEELENRLKMLRIFRDFSKQIQVKAAKNRPLFSREAFLSHEFGFLPPQKINADFLRLLAEKLINYFPKPDLLPERTLAKVITIEEKIRELANRIQASISGPLDKIISAKNKTELIVGFLALLELIKQDFFEVEQNGLFGEVRLNPVSPVRK